MQHKLRPVHPDERIRCMEAFDQMPQSIRNLINRFPITIDMRSFPDVLHYAQANGEGPTFRFLHEQALAQLRKRGLKPHDYALDVHLTCSTPVRARAPGGRLARRMMSVKTYDEVEEY